MNDCVYAWRTGSNVPTAKQPPNLGCDGQVFYERPYYSASAKAEKREGEVSATFDVDDKGKARNIVLTGTPEFYRDTKALSHAAAGYQAALMKRHCLLLNSLVMLKPTDSVG